VFLALSHDRRRVLDCGVTAHPTSAWTNQQLTEAFPFKNPPRFVLHDRGGLYGDAFRKRVKSLGQEVLRPPRRPWKNAYVEGDSRAEVETWGRHLPSLRDSLMARSGFSGRE
jgi:hypothetical protein